MYRVILYNNEKDTVGTVLHEPSSYGNKVVSGKVNISLNAINTAELTLPYDNSLYRKINPIINLVKIFDTDNGEVVFDGRVSKVENDFNGSHTQIITCEDCLGYLHDSIQEFRRIPMNDFGVDGLFRTIIDQHNSQVEPHKRFKVNEVTVSNNLSKPIRYIDYKDSFETIKTRLIDLFGGYISFERNANNELLINYYGEVGVQLESPIKLGVNMKSAKRTLDISNVSTRLYPMGDNIEQVDDGSGDTGTSDSEEVHDRYTIASVNNGLKYIEDEQLKGQFGLLGRVEEYQTNDPNVLLQYGWNYLKQQRVGLLTWDLTVINYSLLNSEYLGFSLGNRFPVTDEFLNTTEYLQIVEKELDIVKPSSITIKVGNKDPNLSDYQNNLQSQVNSVRTQSLAVQSSVSGAIQTVKKVSGSVEELDKGLAENTEIVTEQKQKVSEHDTKINDIESNLSDVESRLKELEANNGRA